MESRNPLKARATKTISYDSKCSLEDLEVIADLIAEELRKEFVGGRNDLEPLVYGAPSEELVCFRSLLVRGLRTRDVPFQVFLGADDVEFSSYGVDLGYCKKFYLNGSQTSGSG